MIMGSIIIRQYNPSDFFQLKKLLSEAFHVTINRETLEENYISNIKTILIAEDCQSDSAVGCAFVSRVTDYIRNERSLFISYVAVEHQYQHKGVGTMLFDKIKKIAKEQNCTAIELTSADFRIGAHAFYESIGFNKKKTTVFINDKF